MHNRTILVCIFTLIALHSLIRADGCPCENFTSDITELELRDLYDSTNVRMSRLSECIKCREELGLQYALCTQVLQNSIKDSSTLIVSKDSRYILDLAKDYLNDCNDTTIVDIDRLTNGKALIGYGTAMFISGITLNIISVPIFGAYYNKHYKDDDSFIIPIVPELLFIAGEIAGIALDAGGITALVIGTHKASEYEKFQIELPRFKEDMLKLGVKYTF